MEKNTIVAILMGMILINLVGAVDIFAGESISFMIPEAYEYYSIIGNSTEVDLNITIEGNNVTITINKYMKTDSFEVIFFNKEKEVIHHYSSSGGGSRTIYKNVTEYIEVDNYIDKVVEDDEIEEPKEIEEPLEKEGGSKWYLWLIGIVVISLIVLGVYLYVRRNK